MRDDRERLLDIQEAIKQIEKYTIRGKQVFLSDELIQNWVIHHLQIIGEASNRLSKDFREKHPGISWTDIIGMRHILVHNYFDVDLKIVWTTVEKDLSMLKQHVNAILKT